MAKRKRNHKSGGGFGGSRRPRPRKEVPPGLPVRPAPGQPPEAEQVSRLIGKLIADKEFASEQEFNDFMAEQVVGKSPEALAAMVGDVGGDSPVERADDLLLNLPPDAAASERVDAARRALEISDECVSAWLILSKIETTPEAALRVVERGLRHGHKRFADLIAEVKEEGLGLWGWVEARDFLRLLREKALLQETLEDVEAAAEAYREMLRLNPDDNLGVRGELLFFLILGGLYDEARDLLDRYRDDDDVAMVWGTALLEITRAIQKSGYEPPEEAPVEGDMEPRDYIESLGPDFTPAIKAVKDAIKVNPWVPLMFSQAGLLEARIGDQVTWGGPYEAVGYLQRWGAVWSLLVLPTLFFTAYAPRDRGAYKVKGRAAEEFADLNKQFERYRGRPWWEDLAASH